MFFNPFFDRVMGESFVLAGPTGIEPATYGLRVRRSSLAELRARVCFFLESVSGKYRVYGLKMSGLSVAMPSTPFFWYSVASFFVFMVQAMIFRPFWWAFWTFAVCVNL
jgi:hypothetical protein